MNNETILEMVRDKIDERIFISEEHEVFASVDAFPKLPFQSVIAPFYGTPGNNSHFNNLDRITKRKLFEVADAVGEKILRNCNEDQRVITHIEGYGVTDHPHIVMFAAERGQGVDLYQGSNLGLVAVASTLKVIKFNPAEADSLEARLNSITS